MFAVSEDSLYQYMYIHVSEQEKYNEVGDLSGRCEWRDTSKLE